MKVIIFGCGRTGSMLARMLVKRNHDVTVIERDRGVLDKLGERPGCKTILGNGLDREVLEKAGIQEADAFLSCTRGDNTNLMSAQLAQKVYNVPKVCAKVNDPIRADVYRELGVFCITPNLLTAGMMRNWLLDEPYAQVDSFNIIEEALR